MRSVVPVIRAHSRGNSVLGVQIREGKEREEYSKGTSYICSRWSREGLETNRSNRGRFPTFVETSGSDANADGWFDHHEIVDGQLHCERERCNIVRPYTWYSKLRKKIYPLLHKYDDLSTCEAKVIFLLGVYEHGRLIIHNVSLSNPLMKYP